MNFLELTQTRESCRSYLDKQFDEKLFEKIFACVSNSPSACNSQPYQFICVGGEKKAELAPLVQDVDRPQVNKFSDQAPWLVVVCEQPAKLFPGAEKRGGTQFYAQLDIGIALATFCYGASEVGLSTCIMGYLNEEKIKELLDIPADNTIRAVLAVGYYKGEPRGKKNRKDLDKLYKIVK